MKSTKIFSVVLIAACALLMTSCNSPKKTIQNLELFKSEILLNGDNYTMEDWNNAKTNLLQYQVQISKIEPTCTEQEKTYVNELYTTCDELIADGKAKLERELYGEGIRETGKNLGEGIKGFWKALWNKK
jgi:hypothetical protein